MTEEEIEPRTRKKRISIDFGRQGGIFLGYTIIILGFYGIVANTITYDWHYNEWIPFLDIDRTLLIWPYLSWPYNFFIPFTLLFGVCFWLTYKEDIPAYGIKASFWLVPIVIAVGFIFYWWMFGFSLEPFILQFLYVEGYINVMLLYLMALGGAFSGMFLKKYVVARRKAT